MREYMIHEAQSRQAYRGISGLVQLYRNWRLRKEMRQLLGWSDFALRDIGLTRRELGRLLNLPAGCDLQWETERRGWDEPSVAPDQAKAPDKSPWQAPNAKAPTSA
jgi:uncharacterized protein YjiS (DUF1127 family)